MRHTNDGAWEFGQELLEPLNTFRIQVVGRLVEQQHIWLREQETTQRDTPFLTAREFAHVRIPWWQAQGIGRDFHLRAHVV